MKLVINSHKAYERPLTVCLQSLIDIKFTKWSDVIIVIGGCDEEESHGPKKVKLMHIFSVEKPSVELPLPNEIVLIKTPFENFDFTAAQMLYEHLGNELIDAELYFYVLETVTFEKEFLDCFENHPFVDDLHDIYTVPPPNSNLSVFKKGVIERYQDNYKNKLTKKQVIYLEARRGSQAYVSTNDKVRVFSLLYSGYGEIKTLKGREHCCSQVDIYNTGKPRGSCYYPDFGVCKYIYHMDVGKKSWHGDLTGKYED